MTEKTQQPTPRQLAALRRIGKLDTTASTFVDEAEAEECVKAGWAEALSGHGGGYELTAAGWRALTDQKPD